MDAFFAFSPSFSNVHLSSSQMNGGATSDSVVSLPKITEGARLTSALNSRSTC